MKGDFDPDIDLRVLTVRPPWSWAIDQAADRPEAKRLDNRRHRVTFRGWVAIHAGAAWSFRGGRDPRVQALYGGPVEVPERIEGTRYLTHPSEWLPTHPWAGTPILFGAVTTLVRLVDCHRDLCCCGPWGESSYEEADGRLVAGVWHWVFDHALRLPSPICGVRGRLGLWKPDDELREAILDLAREAERLARPSFVDTAGPTVQDWSR